MNPQQQVRPAPLPQELVDAGWKLQSSPRGYFYTNGDGLTQWFRPFQPSGEPDMSPELRDAGWCYLQGSQAGPGDSSRTVGYLQNTKTQKISYHLPCEATPSAPSASASATTPQVIDVEADFVAKLMKTIDEKFVNDGKMDDFEAVRAILIKELVSTSSEGGLNASRVLRLLHERGDGAIVAAAGVFGVVERAGDMGVWVCLADGGNAGYTADELRDAGQVEAAVEAAVAAALGAGKRKQPEAPSTTPAPKKPRATPREDASTVMAVAPPETLAPARAVPIDVDAPPPTSRDKPIIIDDDDTPAPPAPTSLDKPIIIDDD